MAVILPDYIPMPLLETVPKSTPNEYVFTI